MLHIRNNNTVFFDVDETLILHRSSFSKHQMIDPTSKYMVGFEPHEKHIILLKQYKARGFFIVVWSKAGDEWANAVVKNLALDSFVDIVMTKPDRYIDDSDNILDVLGQRVYIKPYL